MLPGPAWNSVSATMPTDWCLTPTASAPDRVIVPRLRPLDILVLSAWCGLAGGMLEVVARIIGTTFFSSFRLYLLSRHFVWLAPLSNLLLFFAMGLVLA